MTLPRSMAEAAGAARPTESASMPVGRHLLEVRSLEARSSEMVGNLLVVNFRATRRGNFAEFAHIWNLSGPGRHTVTRSLKTFFAAVAVDVTELSTSYPDTLAGRVVVVDVVEKQIGARPDVKFNTPIWIAPTCEEVLIAARDGLDVRRRYDLLEPHLVALDAVYEERWDLVAEVCATCPAPLAMETFAKAAVPQ